MSEPQEREIRTMTYVNGRTIAAFQLKAYGALFGALRSMGFLIIDSTFVTDTAQIEGHRPQEFRTMEQEAGQFGTQCRTGGRSLLRQLEKMNAINGCGISHCCRSRI